MHTGLQRLHALGLGRRPAALIRVEHQLGVRVERVARAHHERAHFVFHLLGARDQLAVQRAQLGAVAVAHVARGARQGLARALRFGREKQDALAIEAFEVDRRGALIEFRGGDARLDVGLQELALQFAHFRAEQICVRGGGREQNG